MTLSRSLCCALVLALVAGCAPSPTPATANAGANTQAGGMDLSGMIQNALQDLVSNALPIDAASPKVEQRIEQLAAAALNGDLDAESYETVAADAEAGTTAKKFVLADTSTTNRPAKARAAAAAAAKLKARRDRLRGRQNARMKDDERTAVDRAFRNAKWVDNGDGTETKTFSFTVTRTVNGATFTRVASGTRTVEMASGELVSTTVDFCEQYPNGMNHTFHREKTLQEADGSYLVTVHSVFTHGDKTTRWVDFSKTIAQDDTLSGGGTFAWYDATGAQKILTYWTFGGKLDAPTHTKSTNATAGVATPPASVTPGTAACTAAASASPAASSSPTASTSPAASPSASPTASASASPMASSSPVPSASAS